MNIAMEFDEAQSAEGGDFLAQLPAVLWHRRWWIIFPALIGAAASIAAALLIPPVYQSSAVMLVQSSQLPDEIVGNMGEDLIDRRIARIKQQVTSRPDLVSLIQRLGLYPDKIRSRPLSEVVEEMRESITLAPTVAEIPGARNNERTIAFKLAFDYPEPGPAQAVAQSLMDRILELQASGSIEDATSTAQFLSDQSRDLEAKINDVQEQIASIAARNGGVLANSGLTMLGGNSGSYDVQIANLQRDNANLIAQRNLVQTADQRDPLVANAEAQLAAARATYSDSHPDVVAARQRLAEARALARQNVERAPVETIDQQVEFNNRQIAALRSAKAQEVAQVSARLADQARAPLVQQQISELQQRLAALNQQYEETQNRLLAAQAGVRAEDQQMGERLSVVEPPIVPDTPAWPDRLLIIALGIGGSLGLGFVLAFAIELLLRPIRDPKGLAAITGAAPLGVVPVVPGGRESKGWLRRLKFWRRAESL